MDSNVRDEFYEAPESMNKTAVGAHVQTYFPITSNIAAGVIAGQIVFELNTGGCEYLDLFKTHLQLQYTATKVAADNASFGDCPLSNIIARGQLYINGKKVAASQNWTQDAILSKRINFSKTYNQSVNNLTYNNIAAALPFTDGPIAAVDGTTYTDDEFLDALFIRDESCIVPPNSNVRLLLDVDSAYKLKMALLTVAAVPDPAIVVNSIKMVAYTIVKAGGHPSDYTMNLITLNSFLSSIGGTQENRQYQVSPTIVKAACTFQSTAYASAADPKLYAGNLLNYATDTAATRVIGLDFKLNNIVIPNTRWDFTNYGFREAYLNYVNESGGIADPSAKERQAEYQRYGMIHIANIVKPESDKSNSLQVNVSFAAQPAARMLVTSFEENVIRFVYDSSSGALVDTMTLI